jgi:hypothetical protein
MEVDAIVEAPDGLVGALRGRKSALFAAIRCKSTDSAAPYR